MLRRAYRYLVSPKLAIALLVAVLACCVGGVTIVRDEQAWRLIFSTLWFNALLALLALSSGAAFFTRIWRRKLTLVSAGMVLFHLSFVVLLGAVVVNSLFHFRGVLRLTEGETLANGAYESYDLVEHGYLFRPERLRGETTLLEMHPSYTVGRKEKRAAYEVSVGDGAASTAGVVYMTRALSHDGVRYLQSKEGYSVLVVMSDRQGRELYGAHVPLQSLRDHKGAHVYVTGSTEGAGSFPFPAPPETALAELLVSFQPDAPASRAGTVGFIVAPLSREGPEQSERVGEVPVGGAFDAGDFTLSPKEIRFWVGMDVRYDPALPVIFASLCSGLFGMVLTFVGRVRQGGRKTRARDAEPLAPSLPGTREEIA